METVPTIANESLQEALSVEMAFVKSPMEKRAVHVLKTVTVKPKVTGREDTVVEKMYFAMILGAPTQLNAPLFSQKVQRFVVELRKFVEMELTMTAMVLLMMDVKHLLLLVETLVTNVSRVRIVVRDDAEEENAESQEDFEVFSTMNIN